MGNLFSNSIYMQSIIFTHYKQVLWEAEATTKSKGCVYHHFNYIYKHILGYWKKKV